MNKNAALAPAPQPATGTSGPIASEKGNHNNNDDDNNNDDNNNGRVGRWWSEEETMDLLQMISREKVAAVLDGKRKRNGHVFRRLSIYMDNIGYPRTPEQIRSRWKLLKTMYINNLRRRSRVSGGAAKLFKNRYFGIMSGLLKQMSAKESQNDNLNGATRSNQKSNLQTQNQNGANSNNSTDDTGEIRMEIFTEFDEVNDNGTCNGNGNGNDNDNDHEDDDDDYQDQDEEVLASMGTSPAATKIVAASKSHEMDAGVHCILDEAGGGGGGATESSELRSMLNRHQSCQERTTAKLGTSDKGRINPPPRGQNQYTKKDKVAEKLISLLSKQTKMMEDEQKWRRDYVIEQQQWEEQMLNSHMKQLESMMINVTKMLMTTMVGQNNSNNNNTVNGTSGMNLSTAGNGNVMPPMGSPSWSHATTNHNQPTSSWMSNGPHQRM